MCNQKQACIICDKALHYIKYRSMLYESVFIINMYFFFSLIFEYQSITTKIVMSY